MSRAKLANDNLRFYTSNGGSETTKIKLKATNNTLSIEGATAGTTTLLSNLTNPSGAQDAATKSYVDSQLSSKINGLTWKEACVVRSVANLASTFSGNVITLSANGALTVDGITLALNNRVLVMNQTTASQNGIYIVTQVGDARAGSEAPCKLARAADADTAVELKACAAFIEKGTLYANSGFVQTADDIILNTTSITFEQFASFSDILAGGGLSKTGNTISADPDDTSLEVSGGKLAIKTEGVATNDLGNKVVTAAKIADTTITKAQLANDCIEAAQIKDGEVGTLELANSSVSTIKLADDAVDADKLASNAVVTASMINSAVDSNKLADNAVTTDKISDANVTTVKLANGSVTTAKIGTAQVTGTEIADNSISPQKLASNAVTTAKIAASNVTTDKLANVSVTTAKMATNSVDATIIKNDAVETNKIKNLNVTEAKLANQSVTTSKIGSLSSLTVNGLVTATGFLASGSGSEADGGFALPKSKSLSIDFNTDQTISGNNAFATIGSAVSGAGLTFTYNDNITMAFALCAFRINHTGTNNTNLSINFETSEYDAQGNAGSFSDLSGNIPDFQLYTDSGSQDFLLSHQAVIGDGSTRIASIRMRVKHDQANDTVKVTDSAQLTAIAVSDDSGNTTKTYSNGNLT